jgi:hypothetical protein
MKSPLSSLLIGFYFGGILTNLSVTSRIAPHQSIFWHLWKALKWPIDDPFK